MSSLSAKQLEAILGQIRKDNPEEYKLVDVVSLAQQMADSLNQFAENLDTELYKEFRLISEQISKMKDDIAQIQTSSLSSDKIPEAGRELGEIVKSTETATNKIMESAELIIGSESEAAENHRQVVNAAVMDIFEACSFQDLTGQRVSRVIETLDFIDRRLVHLHETIGDLGDNEALFEEEKKLKKRKDDLILHGPQGEGEGESQDNIDALFD